MKSIPSDRRCDGVAGAARRGHAVFLSPVVAFAVLWPSIAPAGTIAPADSSVDVACSAAEEVFPGGLPEGWKKVDGTEPWWLPGEARRRGLMGCAYHEDMSLPATGDRSVCPAETSRRGADLERLLADVDESRHTVKVIIDGSEDLTPIAGEVVRELARVVRATGRDLQALTAELRERRAGARAECARSKLSSSAGDVPISVGVNRTEQSSGRRGTIAFLVVRPAPAPAPPSVDLPAPPDPTPPRITPAPVSTEAPPIRLPADSIRASRPAAPGIRVGPGLRVSYVVGAEGTRFWVPGSVEGIGVQASGLHLGPAAISMYAGYAFADMSADVQIRGRESPVHLQHHTGVLTGEVGLFHGLKIGLNGYVGVVLETLYPGTVVASRRTLLGFGVGPSVAYDLLSWEERGLRLEVRYDLTFVGFPSPETGSVGRVHQIGPSLSWTP